MTTSSARTNNFGTEGLTDWVMRELNLPAGLAFQRWLDTHVEVGGAAVSLDEATFHVWMDNNVERLLREFDRTLTD